MTFDPIPDLDNANVGKSEILSIHVCELSILGHCLRAVLF